MLGSMSGRSAGTQAGLHGSRRCARRFRAIRGCSGCNISGIEMREVGAAVARRVHRIAGGLRRLRRALDDRGVGVTGLHMLTMVQFLFAVIGHRADTLNPITSDRQVRFQARVPRRRTRGRGGAVRAGRSVRDFPRQEQTPEARATASHSVNGYAACRDVRRRYTPRHRRSAGIPDRDTSKPVGRDHSFPFR